MNRKQRRAALKILNKKAYVTSPTRVSLESILDNFSFPPIPDNISSLSTEDINQYIQKGALLFLDQAKSNLAKYTDSIRETVEKAASNALAEIDSLEKGQGNRSSSDSFEEAAADD